MFNVKLKTLSGLISIGLLTFSATSVQALTCNGRTVTTHITDKSQLTAYGRTYELVGTQGNDTILIDLPNMAYPGNGQKYSMIRIKLRGSGVVGGKDYVCVKSDVDKLYVYGGNYLKSRGVSQWVNVSELKDNAYVDLDSPGQVETGNGNNTVIIDFEGSYYSRVIGGKGDDNIIITTPNYVVVETKGGNDTINIKLLEDDSTASVDAGDGDDVVVVDTGSAKGRSLVVGGLGEDIIETGNGSDLVYGANYNPSGEDYLVLQENGRPWRRSLDNFYSVARTFESEPTSKIRAHLNSRYYEDTDGGEITTNGGDDYIYGTNGTDYLRGGAGKDLIYGEGARDRLWGGSGSDYLYGGDGNDDIYGESGNDTMNGNDGNDLMKGGTGDDIIKGNAGNDTLVGNEDDDAIDGGTGTDECRGSEGKNTLVSCE